MICQWQQTQQQFTVCFTLQSWRCLILKPPLPITQRAAQKLVSKPVPRMELYAVFRGQFPLQKLAWKYHSVHMLHWHSHWEMRG